MKNKAAVVCHSGGMDSSICLAAAIREQGADKVVSLSFAYQQTHENEVRQAARICADWGVEHVLVTCDFLRTLTSNALMDRTIPFRQEPGQPPNTLVMGRNGLLARLGSIYAESRGARLLYMGVIGVEGQSGYRDCSRDYMDKMQEIMRIDLGDDGFEIRTPVIHMTKKETLIQAHSFGILPYLLENTITCYDGLFQKGCQLCPACKLRNEGIAEFRADYPDLVLPY